MTTTTILINEETGEITVERAISDKIISHNCLIKPDGDKGWLVALLLQPKMSELMSKPLSELQELHINMNNQ